MITILLTHYNQKKYIKAAIKSVLKQTDQEWKLLICDDCSELAEYNYLQDYVLRLNDSRVKLIRNSSNLGKIGTLKRLIKEADTELCGLLDGDDALTKDAIATVKQAYKKDPDLGFTYSAQYICDEWLTPRTINTSKQINKDVNFLQAFYFTAFRTLKRSVYYKNIEIDEKYSYSDDNDMSYKLEEVAKGLYISKPIYYYRFLPLSMSHDPKKWQRAKIGHFQSMLAALKRREGTDTPSLTKLELKERLDKIRRAQPRLVKPFSERPFDFIYHFIKYNLFTKKLPFAHEKKVTNPIVSLGEKLKMKFKKNTWHYPAKYKVIFSNKRHLIAAVKSEFHKFAFLNIQANACTYLSYLVIKYNWGLDNEVDDIVQDLIGYEHDGEYRVPSNELASLDDYVRFAVYRDPLDRFLSYYRKLDLEIKKSENSVLRFLDCIEEKLNSSEWTRLDLRLLPQSYFLKEADIDYLVPMDKLNVFLKEKFDIEPRSIEKQQVESKLSDECLKKIKSIYAEDYKILDKFKDITF